MVTEMEQEWEQRRARLYQHIRTLFDVEDMRGIEVFSALGRLTQLVEVVDAQMVDGQEISLPRWRLLLHLFIAEQMGGPGGVTPTALSHSQQVSKNTTSSLLRGLEEQGLITREIDSKDLRIFRIRLTDAGRQLILKTGPQRIETLNRMLSGLKPEEVEDLVRLLNRLRHSLEGHSCPHQKDQSR